MSDQKNYLIQLEALVLFLNEEFKKNTEVRGDIGLLRLHLSIYFLYAYYGSSYGRLPVSVEGVCENIIEYPKYLVDVEFKPSSYGVTVKGVKDILEKTSAQERKKFNKDKLNINDEAGKYDLMLYLKEVVRDINKVSEFSLVDRAHEDAVWFEAYHNNRDIINNDNLIEEYITKFKR